METETDFISLGSKITADGDFCHEFKRQLLLGRKAMTNLDRVLNRATMETVTDFLFLDSTITADGDCSHEKMLAP